MAAVFRSGSRWTFRWTAVDDDPPELGLEVDPELGPLDLEQMGALCVADADPERLVADGDGLWLDLVFPVEDPARPARLPAWGADVHVEQLDLGLVDYLRGAICHGGFFGLEAHLDHMGVAPWTAEMTKDLLAF